MSIKLLIICLILCYFGRISFGDNYIFRGSLAKPGQFPYQISLRGKELNHLCGGAILSKRWVVTAKHCITNSIPADMKVVAGSIFLYPGGITHDIMQLIFHPDDTNVFKNDIGLVKVTQDIIFNNETQPIAINKEELYPGVQGIVSGWGRTESIVQPNHLQFVHVKLISLKKCVSMWTSADIDDSLVCSTGRHGQGFCSGDSGGPLAVDGKLVGVVSYFHISGCGRGIPDVYTKVKFFSEWIDKNID